jgi:hypothetical protein
MVVTDPHSIGFMFHFLGKLSNDAIGRTSDPVTTGERLLRVPLQDLADDVLEPALLLDRALGL